MKNDNKLIDQFFNLKGKYGYYFFSEEFYNKKDIQQFLKKIREILENKID